MNRHHLALIGIAISAIAILYLFLNPTSLLGRTLLILLLVLADDIPGATR